MTAPDHIEQLRDASRRLVRELGFMRATLAGTSLSPSAVHALIELEAGARRAGDLAATLRLEKSSVSRMTRKLIGAGIVRVAPGSGDGRTKILSLTAKGRKTLAGIHHFAREQVATALALLPPGASPAVAEGIGLYADALAGKPHAPTSVTLETGYAPGLLARCTALHADYYTAAHGFGRAFEARVAQGLAEFSDRMDRARNRFWRAMVGERVVGTIAIDGEDLGNNTAHLRWFILADEARGKGAGLALLKAALAFCDDMKFAETQLWTFRGLDRARRLYEAEGFVLAEEYVGAQWGREVMEQRFVRPAR